MGCGTSRSAPPALVSVAPPEPATPSNTRSKASKEKAAPAEKPTASCYSAPGAVRFEGDLDSGFARAYEDVDAEEAMVARYPLHCMKMADFLALDTLEPHNKLLEQGKVVPMDLELSLIHI